MNPTMLMMIGALLTCLALLGLLLATRRRRRALAEDLHELRGSLTAARLAVDLMPLLGLSEPSVCMAASDELERSYHSLGSFERRLHSPLVASRRLAQMRRGGSLARRLQTRGTIEARSELRRLTMIWAEAARRNGRTLRLDWQGPSARVRGHRRFLTEAITNLLSNAIRHGDGEIDIVARVRDGLLRIEVRDQGPGLTRPVASLAAGKRLGPHGHGLAVAVRSAQRLGGSVTSAPSTGGAVLVLELPAVEESGDEVAELIDLYAPLPGERK